MWTMTTPAVFGVIRDRRSSRLMASVSRFASANTGVPPAWTTAAAVAKNVLSGTMTSLPSIPNDQARDLDGASAAADRYRVFAAATGRERFFERAAVLAEGELPAPAGWIR